MSQSLLRRRTIVAVTSAAVLGTALLSGTASAATTAEPVSTAVPIVTPDGVVFSYILNAKHANQGQVTLVSRAVEKAGGVVVQSWPEIGVVVAHADRAAFRADVAAQAGGALESVGASRTVAVSEGTPDGVTTPWDKNAMRYRPAPKHVNGDIPGALAPASATDPREVEQWDMQMIKADQAHRITDGSRNVLVGVLDSGIDPTHPDLQANIDVASSVNCTDAGRPDLSPTGWYDSKAPGGYHGTHVAGTIAAARNGIGIVGVAPNVRLASVKVVNDDGFIYPEYAICGFVWAGLKHMDVTNNSYYVDPFEFYCEDQPDQYAAKEAVRKADPVILEPMMAVEVRTPEEYMGDVIGDINSRRGHIQAMEDISGAKVVKGLVPLSEMFGYVGDLRSKTQGRANYSMEFDSYAEVPKSVAEEIIAKTRGE